jgi:hypothetical protein
MNYMEQSSSCEPNSCSASQAPPYNLWTPKFHFLSHNSPKIDPIPKNINLVNAIPIYFFNIYFNIDMIWYDVIYLFTAIGLTPGGSSTVYIYTQTIHRTTQSTQTIHRTTQSTQTIHRTTQSTQTIHRTTQSTQTIHRTTQSTQTVHRTTQLTKWKEFGPRPVFASYTLAFALQLRKRHGKTSVRVAEEYQLARWKQK